MFSSFDVSTFLPRSRSLLLFLLPFFLDFRSRFYHPPILSTHPRTILCVLFRVFLLTPFAARTETKDTEYLLLTRSLYSLSRGCSLIFNATFSFCFLRFSASADEFQLARRSIRILLVLLLKAFLSLPRGSTFCLSQAHFDRLPICLLSRCCGTILTSGFGFWHRVTKGQLRYHVLEYALVMQDHELEHLIGEIHLSKDRACRSRQICCTRIQNIRPDNCSQIARRHFIHTSITAHPYAQFC